MRLASVFEPCFRHYYLAYIISHHLKNNYEVKFKKKKFNIYSFYCCTDALCGNFSKKVSIVAPSFNFSFFSSKVFENGQCAAGAGGSDPVAHNVGGTSRNLGTRTQHVSPAAWESE